MKFLRGCFLLVLLALTQAAARPVATTKAAVRPNTKAKKAAPRAATVAKKTAAATPVAMPAWKADLLHRAKVGFYFGLWYALNIVYNSK